MPAPNDQPTALVQPRFVQRIVPLRGFTRRVDWMLDVGCFSGGQKPVGYL
jgi:hypothetical protein